MLITSTNNPKVLAWAKLSQSKHQKVQKQFIIEEKLLIKEALKAGLNCELIAREGFEIEADYYVSDSVMKKISENKSLNDVVAVCDFFDLQAKQKSKIIYLDSVQDPGNVGTIIRTAYAFGFDLVVLANDTVNKYNNKLIRATQGALFHLPICESLDLNKFHKKGYSVLLTTLDPMAKKLEEFEKKDKLIVVFGNEGQGISDYLLKMPFDRLYIEMSNFESLNVAISAGIVLHHFK